MVTELVEECPRGTWQRLAFPPQTPMMNKFCNYGTQRHDANPFMEV